MVSNRRGFPVQLNSKVKKGLKDRGDSVILQNGNITITLWQDTKPVLIITNNTKALDICKVSRKKRDSSKVEVDCPLPVKLYNKYMGGVDRNDQLRKYYNFTMKSHKFYMYLFFFLFQLSITNSFILCRHYTDADIQTIKKFRQQLATSLIGSYNSRKRRGCPSLSGPSKRPTLTHFSLRGAQHTPLLLLCSHSQGTARDCLAL